MGISEEGIRLLTEEGKGEFAVIDSFLETSAVDGSRWRSRLLEDPGNNSVGSSSSGVLSLFSVPKWLINFIIVFTYLKK